VPALIRRRLVWLPTLWGGLLLLVLVAGAAVMLGRDAYALLAPNEPAHGRDGSGARTLVVEGWLGQDELIQAAARFRAGHYRRVLTTGGPIEAWSDVGGWHSYALRAAAYLRAHGLAESEVIALPAPASAQDRTYLSAVMVRDWGERTDTALEAIDLVSAGVHARRSRWLYRMALGSAVEVGVYAARPTEFDAVRWWTSSAGVKLTLGEVLGLAWTACCFWPAAHGTLAERWAAPARPVSAAPPPAG
jgi:uncharacterized SAM-binding protein YcdF (DUF218 family)